VEQEQGVLKASAINQEQKKEKKKALREPEKSFTRENMSDSSKKQREKKEKARKRASFDPIGLGHGWIVVRDHLT